MAVQVSQRGAVGRHVHTLRVPVGDPQPDPAAARQTGHAQVVGQGARDGQRRVELGAALLGRRVVGGTQLEPVAVSGAGGEVLRTLGHTPDTGGTLRTRGEGRSTLSLHNELTDIHILNMNTNFLMRTHQVSIT